MGRYLFASALRDRELRDQARADLDRVGWTDGECVAEAVFERAVRRLFPPGYEVRQVTEFAAEASETFGADVVPLLPLEALLRRALGEQDVAVDDIDPTLALQLKMVTLLGVTDVLELSPEQLGQLMADAEGACLAAGHQPAMVE